MAPYDPDLDTDTSAQEDAQTPGLTGLTPARLPTPALRPTAPGVYSPTPAPAPPQTGLTPADVIRQRRKPSYSDVDTSQPFLGTARMEEEAPKEEGGIFKNLKEYGLSELDRWGGNLIEGGRFLNDQLGGTPEASKTADDYAKSFADAATQRLEKMTPNARRAAMASAWNMLGFSQDKDEQGNPLPSPLESPAVLGNYLTQKVISLGAPLAAIAALAYGGAAAVGGAAVVGGVAGLSMITSGLLFGVSGAGESYEKISDDIAKRPDAQYQVSSEAYRTLRASGMSVDDAKAKMLAAATASVWGSLGVNAAAGVGLGHLTSGPISQIERFFVRRLAGAAEAGGVMAGQAGGTNLAEQTGEQKAGLQTDIDTAAAAKAALQGGAGGAVLGFMAGGRKAPSKAEPPPPTITPDPAAAAAVQAALPAPEKQLALPAPAEPSGPPPGGAAIPMGAPEGSYPVPLGTSPGAPATPNPDAVSFRDVRVSPSLPGEAPTTPTPAPTPTPTTETAAPVTPTAPAASMSATMKKPDLVDDLVATGVITRQQGNRMSVPDLRTRWDQHIGSTAAPESTTVVKGSTPPAAVSETGTPGPAKTAAAPPASERSLPPTPAAAPEVTQVKAETKPAAEQVETKVGATPAPPASEEAGTKASVPFMVTRAMKAELSDRGYTDDQIFNMKPAEAHEILSKPAETKPAAEDPIAAELAKNAEKLSVKAYLEKGESELKGKQRGAVIAPDGSLHEFNQGYGDTGYGPHGAFNDAVGGGHGHVQITGFGSNSISVSTGNELTAGQLRTIKELHSRFIRSGNKPENFGIHGAAQPILETPTAAEPVKGTLKAAPKTAEALVAAKEKTAGVVPEKGGPKAHVEGAEAAPEVTPEVEASRVKLNAELLAATRDYHTTNKGIPESKSDPDNLHSRIDAAAKEMERAIKASTGSPEDVMQILTSMRTRRMSDDAASYNTRKKLADKFEERLKPGAVKAKEASARVAAKRAEVEAEFSEGQRAQAGAGEAKTAEAIEERATGGGEGESAGQTMALEPTQAKVTKASDAKRISGDWIKKVLDSSDPTTVQKAEEEYAKTTARGQPRRKEYATIAAALDTEIKRVDKPAVLKKAQADLERLANAALHTREGTEARKTELNNRVTQLEKLREKVADFAPERIARLKEERAKLADEVKAAADASVETRAKLEDKMAGRKPSDEGPVLDPALSADERGINPRSSRYVQVSRDPRFNTNIERFIQDTEARGVPLSGAELARHIMQDPLVGAEMGPLRALAFRLFKLLHNVPVFSAEQAHLLGYITDKQLEYFQAGRAGGHYDGRPGLEHIVVNIGMARRAGTTVESALHELVHAATFRYVRHLQLNHPNYPDLMALNAIIEELHRIAPEYSGYERATINAALGEGQKVGTLAPHEVLARLMTSPTLQGVAASRQASARLRLELKSLGYGPESARTSIWGYFNSWVRRALGMRTPASASEYTMLDHILRVPQDIIQRGAEWNKEQLLPKDPTLREPASIAYDTLGGALRDKADEVKREMPWILSRVTDRTRPAILQATNLDQIVTSYGHLQAKDYGDTIGRFREAHENIAHATNEFWADTQDKAVKTAGEINKLNPKLRDAMGQLANDATIAQVHLDKPNPHLTTPEQLSTEAALKARYAALPESARATEQSAVKQFADIDERQRTATLKGMFSTLLRDVPDAQKEAFAKAASTKDKLEAFLKDMDTSDVAKADPEGWDKNKELLQLGAEGLNAGWQRGDFVPLRRYGDNVVSWGEGENQGFEKYETRGEAEERAAELRAAGEKVNADIQRTTQLKELANTTPLMNRLETALAKNKALAPHADEIRDMMSKIALEAMTRSDASRMKRRGIKGASIDLAKTLTREVHDTGVRVGYLEWGGDRFNALSDMGRTADLLAKYGKPGEAIQLRQVINELEQRVAAHENPGGAFASLTRRATMFGYLKTLLSWSHGFTASAETYSMAGPRLAARHGPSAVFQLGNNATRLIAPMLKAGNKNAFATLKGQLTAKSWDLTQVFRDNLVKGGANPAHVDAVLGALRRAGLTTHSYTRELRRIANLGGEGGNVQHAFQLFADLMSAHNHAIDVMNRVNVAWTAFNLELKKSGGDRAQSLHYAMEEARNASPNYNLANKNRLSTTAGSLKQFAPAATQFKQYGFFASGAVASLAKSMLRNGLKTPQGREAARAFAGVIAAHAMTAGLGGAFLWLSDATRIATGLYDWVTGATKPHDYEPEFRNMLSDLIGPDLARLAYRGPLEYVTQASLHKRIGFANPFELPPIESFDTPGVAKFFGSLLTGASTEDLAGVAQGLTKMLNGDVLGGLKAALPRPITDAMKAAELAEQGVVTGRGRVLVPPEKITPLQVGMQALGFTPQVKAEAYEGSGAEQQVRDEAQEHRQKLTKAWLDATPADRSSIMAQIHEFNSDPKRIGTRITMDQLLQAQRQQRKVQAQPGMYGLKAPKQGAKYVKEAGRFANAP